MSIARPPDGYRPCQAPGPAWGHCGNGAAWVMTYQPRGQVAADEYLVCQPHRSSIEQFRERFPAAAATTTVSFRALAPAVAP